MFIVLATALFAVGVVFAYFVVLPAAITFLVNFDDTLYNVQIRASYYLSFTSLVLARLRDRVRDADLHPRARPDPGPELRQAAPQPPDRATSLMLVFAILLPTVDPVSLVFETIPLLILFEASIWMAKVMEPRWRSGLSILERLRGRSRRRRRGRRSP